MERARRVDELLVNFVSEVLTIEDISPDTRLR